MKSVCIPVRHWGPPAAEVLQGVQELRRQVLDVLLAAAPPARHRLRQRLAERQLLQGGCAGVSASLVMIQQTSALC
jgi:hypothetical protein